MGCGHWIRDEDDVAAFRCGDESSEGVELCHDCKPKFPFCFKVKTEPFDNTEKRPTPPPGFIKFKRASVGPTKGKCPNCGADKPGIVGGYGGFQNKKIMQVSKAMDRVKNSYDGFCVDVSNPGENPLMLKEHPSRYGVGYFMCCNAKIWHDFFEYPWDNYYKPKICAENPEIQSTLTEVL